jgi:hypothetical protein
MMQQLRDDAAFAAKLREYNDYISTLSQQMYQERLANQDHRNEVFREVLAGVETRHNEYDGQSYYLPRGYKGYWVNRKGEMIISDQAGYNPNVGSTEDWRKMR